MIRLFNVYYPTRTIVLLLCETLIVSGSFLLATAMMLGPDTYLVLNYEYGALKIAGLTVLTLLCSYYFDLYEPQRISARWEIYFRLLLVLGLLSFLLSAVIYFFPGADIAHYVLLLGLIFLTLSLVAWRSAYEWIIGRKMFRERVYVLGAGERARTVVELLQTRKDAGMEVVGSDSRSLDKAERKEAFTTALEAFHGPDPGIDRVIIALEDRRGELPLRELLKLRFNGVVIEEAGTLLERLTGKLYGWTAPEQLHLRRRISREAVAADRKAHCFYVDSSHRSAFISTFFPICGADGSFVFAWTNLFPSDPCWTWRTQLYRL